MKVYLLFDAYEHSVLGVFSSEEKLAEHSHGDYTGEVLRMRIFKLDEFGREYV